MELASIHNSDLGYHGTSTQARQDRTDDWYRPWRCLEQLLHPHHDGEVIDRGRFRTTAEVIEKWFKDLLPTRVAMEVGAHTIWISEQRQEFCHEVIVADDCLRILALETDR